MTDFSPEQGPARFESEELLSGILDWVENATATISAEKITLEAAPNDTLEAMRHNAHSQAVLQGKSELLIELVRVLKELERKARKTL